METEDISKKRPLLTICIPTYNGADRLPDTLQYLSYALKDEMQNVEVIIVDNHSEDNTREIVKHFLKDRRWTYHRNSENLGYNYSVINIIKNLSKGEYSWLIGDDDWVLPTAIEKVVEHIKNDNIDYISIGHKFVSSQYFTKIEDYIEKPKSITCSFETAIEKNCCNSNLLGTFMSSAVFKTDKVKNFDFSQFNKESWTDYKSLFPIGYMMAHTFHKSLCICIMNAEIICIPHKKDWDEKIIIMVSRILPLFYTDLISTLHLKLPKNEYFIRLGELKMVFKSNNDINTRLHNIIHCYYFFKNPKVTFTIFKKVVKKYIKLLYRILKK